MTLNSSHQYQRHLPLEGCRNIRDLGGYPTPEGKSTRWGAVLRADNLDKLPPTSQQVLLDYGLTTVIDLRTEWEVENWPDVFATSEKVAYLQLPLFNAGLLPELDLLPTLHDSYCHILENCTEQIRSIIEAIAGTKTGCSIIHCATGKDRTGIIAALLLGLAGVSSSTIIEDYALTGYYLADLIGEWRQSAIVAGRDMVAFELEVSAAPETMTFTLASLQERFGGVAGYLQAIGLSDATLEQLRARLVE